MTINLDHAAFMQFFEDNYGAEVAQALERAEARAHYLDDRGALDDEAAAQLLADAERATDEIVLRACTGFVRRALRTDAATDIRVEAIEDGLRRGSNRAEVADNIVTAAIAAELATWRAGRR